MATYIWCLGIAVIYPPGALTIEPRPYMSTSDVYVWVMNRAPPTEFDLNTYVKEEPFQTLASLTWSIRAKVMGDYVPLHFEYRYVRPRAIDTL